MDSDSPSGQQGEGLAGSRSRREKKDKHGRLAALERLKSLKGSKNKYEVSEMDNIYEEVDEREYSERVLQRQEDDFIVDDDGAGYAEDGREIFDDDIYVDEKSSKGYGKSSSRGRKREQKDAGEGDAGGNSAKRPKSGDIRKMISNIAHIPQKKKTEVKKLEEDSDLQEILKELEASPLDNSRNGAVPSARQNASPYSTVSAKDYLNSFKPVPSSRRDIENDLPVRNKIYISRPRDSPRSLGKVDDRSDFDVHPAPIKIKIEQPDVEVPAADDFVDFGEDYDEIELPEEPVNEKVAAEEKIKGEGKMLNANEANSGGDTAHMMVDEDTSFLNEFNMDQVWDGETIKEPLSTVANNSTVKPEPALAIKKGDDLANGWETVVRAAEEVEMPNMSTLDTTKLPLIETESKEKVMYFYYLDAHEEYFQQPGVVFLFGKVRDESTKAYYSCCVTVKNMDRKIFLLPREERLNVLTNQSTGKPVSMQDVYEEFDKKVSNTYKILNYKCRSVTKSYAFDMADVPLSSEYLEVRYPVQYAKLPADLRGETFSHAFGVNSSFLELLLLDRKIKGPRWLAIKNPVPVSNHIGWCKLEVSCSPEDLFTAADDNAFSQLADRPPPPLTVLTLANRIVYNKRTSQNEIVCMSGLVSNSFPLDGAPPKQPFQQHFCAMTKISDRPWPLNLKSELCKKELSSLKLEKCESERALLNYFMARYYRVDPDLIVCHDFLDFDLGVLLKKLTDHKIANWSRLGRLKRANKLQGRAHVIRNALCGRLVCDMKLSAKELIKARSYDLESLCQQVLHMNENQRESYTQEELQAAFSDSGSLVRLMKATVLDATYVLRLMCDLNALPLALQITNVAGNVMSRTLMGGRSERNEFLLLHAFTDKGFIVPEKTYGKGSNKEKDVVLEFDEDAYQDGGGMDDQQQQQAVNRTGASANSRAGRRKPQYAGGLVLEPKRGLYDRLVLLMDFNSLYPSIIQEYNICFTTIDRHNVKLDDFSSLALPGADVKPGVLPSEIRQLVESRRVVKKMMANPNISSDLRLQYEIRQLALKLMANSMYGCLGFGNSRFCCKPLAALVTSKGREILLRTKELVEGMSYDVVYGDTDSLMINTNSLDYAAVKKIGQKIKTEVNRYYKQLELDIDGIFRCLLLCKKKKYAASVILGQLPDGTFQTKQEIKGLDVVRRDWCQVSSEAGKFILAQILSEQESDERVENIHKHLSRLREDLEGGKVPLSLLTIAKQLAKAPEDYAEKKAQPHVQVALRANSHGQKRFKAGDTVHYVICEDGTTNAATQRAYLVEEMKTNPDLKVDIGYYLEQQVLPVVSRICEPIDGAEPARIAQSLGLDYKKLEKLDAIMYEDDGERGKAASKEADKFKNCERFSFKCVKCGTDNVMEGATKKLENRVEILVLNRCSNSECTVQPKQYLASIRNKLTLTIRSFINKYYKGWLMCEDPYCTNRKRWVSMRRRRCQPLCDACLKHNSYNVMKFEYTDHELYTQLVYFRSLFDVSKVSASIRLDPEVQSAYDTLQEDVKQVLKLSAYASVDLSNLFFLLTPFATKKQEKP